MRYPSLLLQAQYINLTDRLARHFELRSITRDPAARRQVEDRVRQSFEEIAQTLTEFASDTDASPLLLNRQRAAARLVTSILQVLAQPYDRELFTLASQAFGAFLTQPAHQDLAA